MALIQSINFNLSKETLMNGISSALLAGAVVSSLSQGQAKSISGSIATKIALFAGSFFSIYKIASTIKSKCQKTLNTITPKQQSNAIIALIFMVCMIFLPIQFYMDKNTMADLGMPSEFPPLI